MKRNVVLILRKVEEYKYGMRKVEIMIEKERRKRMELNEIVNVLVVELEREKMLQKKKNKS